MREDFVTILHTNFSIVSVAVFNYGPKSNPFAPKRKVHSERVCACADDDLGASFALQNDIEKQRKSDWSELKGETTSSRCENDCGGPLYGTTGASIASFSESRYLVHRQDARASSSSKEHPGTRRK